MFVKQFFYIALSLQYAHTIHSKMDETHPCTLRETCRECLRDTNDCAFCAADDTIAQKRCQPQSTDMKEWCPEDKIVNPNNTINIKQAEDFISIKDHIIQIKPQVYTLKLRPGREMTFNFSFKPAKNFPVDLYFLMDASTSMSNLRKDVAAQSNEIYSFFKSFTEDVYLGLGTFIDKKLFPMAENLDKKIITYSFEHNLKLGNDVTLFQDTLKNLPVGDNNDEQEGGLDALAQAIVCKELVGWRNDSKKIIIYLTNAPYHAAGHGRFAGLFQPYDGKCYTDNITNTYSKELEMDYPSVGMIDHLAAKNDVKIFFLVDAQVAGPYDILHKAVRGSEYSTFNSPKDVLDTLRVIYKRHSNKIKLNLQKGSVVNRKNIEIKLEPNCTIVESPTSHNCDIAVDVEKKFEGTIKVKEYSVGLDNPIIDIIVEGSASKLRLDIEVLKNCDCEKDAMRTKACNGEKQICGVCSCSEKRYGDHCMCTDEGNNKDILGNTTQLACALKEGDKPCSGYGSCLCGICTCDKQYTGKYCECSIADCPKNIDQVPCSGNGDCMCDKTCKCRPEWRGEACDCLISNETCVGSDGTVCNNNRGTCHCGQCQSCQPFGLWDARNKLDKFCKVQPCSNCHNLQCQKLEKCAICLHQETNDCAEDCYSPSMKDINATLYNTISMDVLPVTWRLCPKFTVRIGCFSSFAYQYKDNDYGLEILVQREVNCSEIEIISGGVVLVTLLLVGLGTLLAWKLITTHRDRKEYKRFCRQNGLDDGASEIKNPIYSSPTTTVQNPAFRKRSLRN